MLKCSYIKISDLQFGIITTIDVPRLPFTLLCFEFFNTMVSKFYTNVKYANDQTGRIGHPYCIGFFLRGILTNLTCHTVQKASHIKSSCYYMSLCFDINNYFANIFIQNPEIVYPCFKAEF